MDAQDPTPPTADRATSRRRLLQAGIGTAAVAWTVPAIVSAPSAAAASPPPPDVGDVQGIVRSCGHEPDPDYSWLVEAVDPITTHYGSATTEQSGAYHIHDLSPGHYDVTLQPNGPLNFTDPSQFFPGAITITANTTTTRDFDYTANGC